MVYRAYFICSSWTLFHEEILNIYNIATFNGFPGWQIDKIIRRFLNTIFSPPSNISQKNDYKNSHCVKFQFLGSPSIILKRQLNRIFNQIDNVKLVFCSRKLFTCFPLKIVTPMPLKGNVVYKFCCSVDPNITYIGKTCRHLLARVGEHLSGDKSAISSHLLNCSHCSNTANINNFKVLKSCCNTFDLDIAEAILIKKHKPFLNKQLFKSGASYSLILF